ncbi:hypothetical protein OAV46_03940 [Euryarchaeota archaeon]|nr:hypothetical protein [Euryarchaeota archaeon]|tara:strand:- start:95 stop:499 length:405 start_codon:yes stop_codon:yes gene_type:complete
MNDNKMKTDERTKLQQWSVDGEPAYLPELDEDEVQWAMSHGSLSWAHGFMSNLETGQHLFLSKVGVHLQKVDEGTVRCIAVEDATYCFAALSMLKVTFETANLELEIAPYTLVTPYIPNEEVERSESAPGLEVA